MNILFFTTISPFPQNGGEKIRSYYLLKALAELGHQVFAIIRNEEQADLRQYRIEGVEFLTHRKLPLGMMDRITGKHYFQQSGEVLRLFKTVCTNYKIDVAFLDYGFIGQYMRFFADRGIPVILGTHNAQAMHTLQVPAHNFMQKLRRSQLVALEKMHERRYFRQAAAVLVVSEHDKAYHTGFIDPEKVFVVPNFLDEREYNVQEQRDPRLLVMTANFGMFMNNQGLKWFMDEVWDDALAEKFELWLVGRQSKETLIRFTGKSKWKNITGIGKVEDMKPYIAKAAAVIIPLLHGSGTRLKCLEAMALRTPVIATSKGVEGVQSSHFIIADTGRAFKQTLQSFHDDGHTGAALREDFMKEYSADVNRQRLESILQFVYDKQKVAHV
ncbi:glycosyltransferase [Chitinophaga cymbidii]|uniref:Polysaccharide biosynthesis protein n=1 Tax=Chitinophaga cymbidii TaxID=1096750 RepID=A0A512RIH3_9BACT|nr:glycosyltransferase [Chitinophaga cymbidii]GEP95485.1 polysaccharide biosynthesis protein [Chitinophaga cymbidii]